MQLANRGLNREELGPGGFDEEQKFLGMFDPRLASDKRKRRGRGC